MDAIGNTRSFSRWNEIAFKEFIWTVVGFAVGLGNVWRLPYLLQSHCPGAFLLPYVFYVLFCGIPLIVLEIKIGTHFQVPFYNTWQIIQPAFGGIGVASYVIAFVVLINYNIILEWLIIYLFSSFQTSLPWTNCTNSEGTDCTVNGPVSFFWNKMVSEISSGHIPCGMFLMVSWMLVYAVYAYRRNTDLNNKCSNGCFLPICLGLMMLILVGILVRSFSLDGAIDGIMFLFKPDISGIFSLQVWLDVISQLCYTYGITFGQLISIGRICKCSRTNTYRTSIIIGILTLFTSILVSVGVYCNLGNIAWSNYHNCISRSGNYSICSLEKELESVGDGPGTTLIATSNITGKFGDFSPVIAIVIFTLFVVVTLITQSETVLSIEEAVNEMGLVNKKTPFAEFLCVAGWILGTVIITLSDNNNLFLLLESASILLPLLVVAQCVAVAHIYGLQELWDDYEFISGTKHNPVLGLLWKWIFPVVSLAIVVFNVPKFFQYSKSFKHSRNIKVDGSSKWIEKIIVSIIVAAPIIFAFVFTLYSNLSKDKIHTEETENSNTVQQQTQVVIQTNNYNITNVRNVITGDNSRIIDFAGNMVEPRRDNEESDEEEWEILEDGLFA